MIRPPEQHISSTQVLDMRRRSNNQREQGEAMNMAHRLLMMSHVVQNLAPCLRCNYTCAASAG